MVVVVPQVPEQKPCDGSFVRVTSKSITEQCFKTIENIKLYKKHDIKRLADRERKDWQEEQEKKRNGIWSKIFGYKEVPEPTDEELIEMHKNSGSPGCIWLPETFWIEFRYQKNLDVAYRLINAAKYADEISVSTKDLERLI